MQVKAWQKALFFTSIGVLILYLQRNRVRSTAKKVYDTLSDNLLEFANRWKGVVEIGNNSSFQNKVFQSMLDNVGWKSGESWCMYFAKAIHWETYVTDRDKINKILNGRTQESYQNAKNDKTGTYTISDKPQIGDIVIWKLLSNPSFGHAGIVTKVLDGDKIETIEGNTSYKSAREGETVDSKVRNSKVGSMLGNDLKLVGYIHKI